jgi:predicted RND superfamily exporter protein
MKTLARLLGINPGYWAVDNRWWIIGLSFVIALSAGSGLQYLAFNRDTRVFFSDDNPQLQALEALENTYVKNYNLLYVIDSGPGGIFERKTLSALVELTETSWETPYSSRVDSITNFQHTYAEEDDLIVEDLVEDAAGLTDTDLERIRAIALAEPLLVNRLVSPSGDVTAVDVNILLPGESEKEVKAVATFARQLAERMRRTYPNLDIHLTGALMIDSAFGEVTEDDMSTLVPIMFAVLLVITGLALRSVAATLATMIVILMATGTALGVAGWLGIALNAASGVAPTIILTLAVADSVHILVAMFRKMQEGRGKRDAIADSIKDNLQPVFITSATTVIGFLSMNFSDAPPFRDLGNIVAVGIASAFFYSVLLLPAVMAVLPVRARSAVDASRDREWTDKPCSVLADFVVRCRAPVFWLSLAVIAVLAIGTTRVELYDDFIEYFGEEYPVRQATDFTEQRLSGADVIEYSLYAGESGGINNPAYLQKVDEFANWYRQQPHVIHVDAITDIMKRLNKNLHGDDVAWYRLPGQRELAAQYLLLYEMSLPFGLDLNNQINVDKSASRMIVTLRDTTTIEQRELEEQGRAWLQTNAPQSMYTYGSGLSIIWAYLSERNIKAMLVASFGALVLISAILVVALRSVKHGLLSLAPNITPALMAFGIWGLLVGQVGLGLSIIVSMTLGIVVDDTVHFLSKYLQARRELGMDAIEAVRHSFQTAGTAMWVTTVALVAGFLVLSFSGYRMNADMGLLSAITIVLALAMDFLFLPTLLIRMDSKGGVRAATGIRAASA